MSTVCVKCSEPGEYFAVDPKQALYCKDCFLRMVEHKFNYCLGKHRIFKEATPQNALLIYTGDEPSALLFSLICNGLAQSLSKRLRINPLILYLFTTGDSKDIKFQMEKFKYILSEYRNQGWKLYFAHISSILNPNFHAIEGEEIIDEFLIEEYNALLKSIKDKSIRRELIRLFRALLIVRIARQIECSKVILPEYADSLANISFNALCFGRGSAICDLTAVVDRRLNDVQFIRPLRDICRNEIVLYHQLSDCSANFITTDAFITESASSVNTTIANGIDSGGIQSQTAIFISSLQCSSFPATVATILSIAGKLAPDNESTKVFMPAAVVASMDDNHEEKERLISNHNYGFHGGENENLCQHRIMCQVCFITNVVDASDNSIVHTNSSALVNKYGLSDTIRDNNISEDNNCAGANLSLCEPCANILAELKMADSNGSQIYKQIMRIFR